MSDYVAYLGLDVHQDTMAVAVATPGRSDLEWCGTIANRRSALKRLIASLAPQGEPLSFCYEAGPCGDGVYRELTGWGAHCDVVAPALVPRVATDRVKTDRRDALKLARLHRLIAKVSLSNFTNKSSILLRWC